MVNPLRPGEEQVVSVMQQAPNHVSGTDPGLAGGWYLGIHWHGWRHEPCRLVHLGGVQRCYFCPFEKGGKGVENARGHVFLTSTVVFVLCLNCRRAPRPAGGVVQGRVGPGRRGPGLLGRGRGEGADADHHGHHARQRRREELRHER